jgi:hypothetical protein
MSRQNMYLRKASMAPARFQMILSSASKLGREVLQDLPYGQGIGGVNFQECPVQRSICRISCDLSQILPGFGRQLCHHLSLSLPAGKTIGTGYDEAPRRPNSGVRTRPRRLNGLDLRLSSRSPRRVLNPQCGQSLLLHVMNDAW